MSGRNPYRVSLEDVEERATASFLGFALGDALGATAEFMTPSEIRAEFGVLRDVCGGGWLRLPAGAVTDDTEMSLCVARSIAARGFCPEDIANRFSAWLKSRPRDVGGTCRRGIRRYITEGTLYASPSELDAGNGAAMRMTPIALATVGDSELLARWGISQAHITHNNPISDAACVFLGQLMHLALTGHSISRLATLTRNFLEYYPVFAFDGSTVHSSAYVVDTVRTVLKTLFSTDNFEDCVVGVVNFGGDADTAGAIVGAIAGAYYGLGQIPPRWLRRLDSAVRSEVEHLARVLASQCPAARTPQNVSVERAFLWQFVAAS